MALADQYLVHGVLQHPLLLPGILVPVFRAEQELFIQVLGGAKHDVVKSMHPLAERLKREVKVVATRDMCERAAVEIGKDSFHAVMLPDGKLIIGTEKYVG